MTSCVMLDEHTIQINSLELCHEFSDTQNSPTPACLHRRCWHE